SMKAAFPSDQPSVGMERLAHELLPLLERHADVTLTSKPERYSIPCNTDFPFYLLRLEQLLAVRCGGMDGVHKEFLSGEREIIDGNIHLCLNNAKNATTTRILLLQTVKAMKR